MAQAVQSMPSIATSAAETAHPERSEVEENLMEHLMFDDDSKSADFLKGLISAAGLQGSWGDLLRRMRGLEMRTAEILAAARREVLERDFVTRPEYNKKVLGTHHESLQSHQEKLANMTNASARNRAIQDDHINQLRGLQERATVAERQANELQGNIRLVEMTDADQHSEVLALHKDAEERHQVADAALQEQFVGVMSHLHRHDDELQVLAERSRQQQQFLEGSQLEQHIKNVCQEILKDYIRKETMFEEVAKVSDHLIKPIREQLESSTKDLETRVSELSEVDDSIEQSLKKLSDSMHSFMMHCDNNFIQVRGDIQLRVTAASITKLEADLRSTMKDDVDALVELRDECTKKLQELVERVGEFQVILEDHEHVLQHHAEELLNRSTKFDLVVVQQRVDKCALREKVKADMKELQIKVEWALTQLEQLGYGKSFGGGGVATAASVSSTGPAKSAPPVPESPLTKSAQRSALQDSSSASTELRSMELSSIEQPTSIESAAINDRRASAESFAAAQGNSQESQFLPLPSQALEKDRPSYREEGPQSSTELISVIRMQLEGLSHGLLGLAQLAVRAVGAGLPRAARADREAELLHHLTCLVQWIMHRRAPLSWNPEKLATLSLRCMRHVSDGEAGRVAGDEQPYSSRSESRANLESPRLVSAPRVGDIVESRSPLPENSAIAADSMRKAQSSFKMQPLPNTSRGGRRTSPAKALQQTSATQSATTAACRPPGSKAVCARSRPGTVAGFTAVICNKEPSLQQSSRSAVRGSQANAHRPLPPLVRDSASPTSEAGAAEHARSSPGDELLDMGSFPSEVV